MNNVILKGRLTKDPEVRYTQGQNGEQMAISRYTLAVNRRNGKDEADYINCVAFGRQGEFAEKYLKKGQEIIVIGRIQTGSYTNKDGQKVYVTDVVVESHEFCGTKQEKPVQAANNGYIAIPDGIEGDLPFN